MLQDLCKDAGIDAKVVNDFAKGCFGESPTVFEYKLIAATIRLICKLPGSHASSSIANTLRGRSKAPVCKKQAEYGFTEGMKKYSQQLCFQLANKLDEFLRQGDVVEDATIADPDEDDPRSEYSPEWIQHKHAAVAEAIGFPVLGLGGGEPLRPEVLGLGEDLLEDTLLLEGFEKGLGDDLVDRLLLRLRFGLAELLAAGIEHIGDLQPPGLVDLLGVKYAAKSVKDGVLTVRWWVGYHSQYDWELWRAEQTVKRSNDPNFEWQNAPEKSAYLTTTWSEDGQELKGWEVEYKDYNRYL